MQNNILIAGSLAFDIIFSIPIDFRKSIPLEDGNIRNFNASYVANEKDEYPGGTGGNIAFWLGQQGVGATLFSAWGKDFSQKGYKKKLEQLGISIQGAEGEFTAHAYMVSDPIHQQLTIWQPNAYSKVDEISLNDYIEGDLQDFQYAIFSAGSPKSIRKHLLEFRIKNNKAKIIFDPGQVSQFFEKKDFLECCRNADILIGNDIEFRYFREYGIIDGIIEIETQGAKGVLVREEGNEKRIEAVKIDKIVETTGAGDAFRAGLLAGFAQGLNLEESIIRGTELGAECVQLPSAQK